MPRARSGHAQLVEEESTAHGDGGDWKEVMERKGVFCALVQRSGEPFLVDARRWAAEVDLPSPVRRWGRALHELGVQMIPASTHRKRCGPQRAQLPQPGRAACRRNCGCTSCGRWRRRTDFLREDYIAEFNRRFQVAPRQRGNAFVPCRSRDLERIFSLQFERSVNRDNTVSFQNLSFADRAGALARQRWQAAR